MDHLFISATTSSPAVSFNAETGVLQITGESYPENTFEFYHPIIRWVKEYLKTTVDKVVLQLEMPYLNTGSIKCLMDIFDLLEDAHENGQNVEVIWRYHPGNPRAQDTAEEFSEDLTFPFLIEAVACE
ncbi:MAG: biofilm regulation phosphoprotein SiaC [Tolumonas sp.]|nr:biofilm regulation phosphoprotein SiaC [Tolumonas sp.]